MTTIHRKVALATKVLVVAVIGTANDYCAYIDAVPGMDHEVEQHFVTAHGDKLPHELAKVLFPELEEKLTYRA